MKFCKKSRPVSNNSAEKKSVFAGGTSILLVFTLLLQLSSCSKPQTNHTDMKTEFEAFGHFSTQKIELPIDIIEEGSTVISVIEIEEQLVALVTCPISNNDGNISQTYGLCIYGVGGKSVNDKVLQLENEFDETILFMLPDNDGNIILIFTNLESEIYVQKIDINGTRTGNSIKMNKTFANTIQNVLCDAEGNLVMSITGEVSIFDLNGNELYSIKDKKIQGDIYSVGSEILVVEYVSDNAGNTTKKLFPLSNSEHGLKSPISLSSSMGATLTLAGCKDGLFALNDSGVFAFDFSTGDLKTVLLWNDSDFQYDSTNDKIYILSKENILVSHYEESGINSLFLLLDNIEPLEQKQMITIGCVGLGNASEMDLAIQLFNESSNQYQAVLKDYAEDVSLINSSEESDIDALRAAAAKQLKLDILAGNGPDILISNDNNSIADYESDELFVDLYTLMNADPEFSKSDYFENAFKVCENNDHLFKISPKFWIYGLAGKESVIGESGGWTINEFSEMTDTLKDGMKPFCTNNSKTDLFDELFFENADEFFNFDTGEVHCDTDYFEKLLSFANEYGVDEALPEYVNIDDLDIFRTYAVSSVVIGSLSNYNSVVCRYGEPVSVYGYPSANRNGPSINFEYYVSVLSNSSSVEGAWGFIKVLLSEEAQQEAAFCADTIIVNIPVHKSVVTSEIQRALNPSEDDLETFGYLGFYQGTGELIMPTVEITDAYMRVISSANAKGNWNTDIRNIVNEEIKAYFAGQKSCQEVAKLIQNRLQIYVLE